MRALISGATGLLGRRLLATVDSAAVLTRDPRRARLPAHATPFAWEPMAGPPPAAAFEGVDAVLHLAGEPVAAGRWSAERKRRIRDSRVLGTQHLVAALGALPRRPPVLVAASAVGYYGDRGDAELDEQAAPGSGFLAEVCRAWEEQAQAAAALGVRVVRARIGLVLAPEGGALPRMLPPYRLGLGGRLGHGKQWMPWIHADDVVGLLIHAAQQPSLSGALNAVSPAPVTNADFSRALARALRRPAVLAAPRAALRLALGELSSVLLASQRAIPTQALRSGYAFRFRELSAALADCLRPGQEPLDPPGPSRERA